MQPAVSGLRGLGRGSQLGLQIHQALLVGCGQGVAVGGEPFTPAVELTRLLLDVALVGGQNLDLLLHLRDAGTLFVGVGLRHAQRLFQVGQGQSLLLHLGGQQHGVVFGVEGLGCQGLSFRLGIGLAGGPLRSLLRKLDQTLLHALASLDHETDFSLEPSDLGTGLVQQPLRLVDLVTRSVMGLANGFQVGLDMAQIRHTAFQFVDRLFGLSLDSQLVGLALAALEEPQLVLLQRHVCLQRIEFLRHGRLFFKLVQVGVEFAQDVLDPGQVFAGVRQAVFSFAPAFLVLGNAGRLFKEQAKLFGPGLDDAADRALTDDGVGARAQAGAQEHVLHVAPAHRLVVDVVAAGAVAREDALDGDLAELPPLPAGAVVGVVEHQFHAGAAGGLAGVGAVENDVLHRFATQFAGAALTQHPAHGIHDVGFSAAIRPDNPHQLPWQQEVGWLDERLEPG